MKIRKIFGSLIKGYKQKLPVTLGHDAKSPLYKETEDRK